MVDCEWVFGVWQRELLFRLEPEENQQILEHRVSNVVSPIL